MKFISCIEEELEIKAIKLISQCSLEILNPHADS